MLKSIAIIGSLGISASTIAAAEPTPIQIHGVERASYTDSSGQLRGKHHGGQRAMLVELTRELLLVMEREPLVQSTAHDEGLDKLNSGTPIALVDLPRDPDSALQWVGPIQDDNVHLYQSIQSSDNIDSIEAAKKVVSICVRRGNGHQQLLEAQGFTNIEAVSSYKMCWDKLEAGEVSLATLNQTLVETVLSADPQASKAIRNTGVAVQQQPIYIGFSAATPAAEVEQWQQTVESFKASEVYQSLVHHYYCQQDCF